MALKYGDRVRETTTTTGTGTVNLAGAEAKYQAFNDVLDTADTCYYAIVHRSANEWEVGYGTFTDAAPDTLARTTVIASSNSNALVSFSAGTKDVFLTLPAIVAAERPGFVKDYAGSTAPEGYLSCDGSNVSRTTYKALFDAIGTTWGVGDGSTTFTLPDLRRRTTVGSGGSGTGTLAATVGSTGGAETHTLTSAEMPVHGHTFSATSGGISANHTHSSLVAAGAVLSAGESGTGVTDGQTGTVSSDHVHGVSGTTDNAGSGGAHNNVQPSAVVLKVIKT